MRKWLLSVVLLISFTELLANNLVLSGITLSSATTLTFNISWENSWRVTNTPKNWDAVWLFVKRKDCASNSWTHVNLSTNSGDHAAAAPLTVQAVSDGKGVLVYRSGVGVGNIPPTSVTITFTGVPAGDYDFQVFGIEMVYIPQDSFYVGDGISTYFFYENIAGNPPYYIRNEGAINMSSTAGTNNLWGNGGGYVANATIPAAFPKGFAPFYCMKYEISQAQYTDFLSTLDLAQAAARSGQPNTNRNGLGGAWPTFTSSAPNRAQNHLSWADLTAYLDWACLSPMTEFEFEKICRGPINPVNGEFAWGTPSIVDANTLVNDGTATEGVSDAIGPGQGIANYGNNIVLGPIRVGFAAKATTNRFQAGATYYGVMEMSGNLWERVVTVSNAQGRAFTGLNGDGILTSAPTPGLPNVPNWPDPVAATGSGFRGGSWNDASGDLRISDRISAGATGSTRVSTYGGRGVRR
ncbi:MAG: SUMF1/EgtB/PvdO family nonheme iron enzyme [Bacteroidia bacterium]|nr:SUMF1/EgtB/PvdO family nonheme iron enzyme [Bacteroidia bacterium]